MFRKFKGVVAAVFGFVCVQLASASVFAADVIPSTTLDWDAIGTELFTKLTPALLAFVGISLGIGIIVACVRWIRGAVR